MLVVVLAAAGALGAASGAAAAFEDEVALAEKHAPVVRLVEQLEECGPGEPYEPMDVDALFGEPTVALRGPWNAIDLIKVGPAADDLPELFEYHLDFPGNALDPGCSYERWATRITEGRSPTVYAHVATDDERPGQLALQYWFFYAFNDWNNLHEGDWETVQLIFDAPDARAALAQEPVAVGYSQHEGTERADWGDEKLELVDGSRPVVYPAAGSHANFYDSALYLGSSAEQGVGCDDTRGPHVELEPEVVTIPSDAAAARSALPWIAFEGRWGELQDAFFNGPTGPNLKPSWTEPVVASEGWRERAYAVPTGGVFGTNATDGFCSVVERGSRALVHLIRNPLTTVLILAALIGLIALAITRTTWSPTVPLRVGRRRAWGQIVSAAGRMYIGHARLFLGIGLLLIPVSLLIALLQTLVFGGLGRAGVSTTGEGAGALVLLVVAIGLSLTLLGISLVQAATACAVVRIDEGGSIGPVDAYRRALTQVRPLLGGIGIGVAIWLLLSATWLLHPRRDLVRDPRVAAGSGRRARGHVGRRRAPAQQHARARPLVAGGLDRRGRDARPACARSISRCGADPDDRGAVRPRQPRRGGGQRARDAVHRADHHLPLLRRAHAARARRRGGAGRAARRDQRGCGTILM